MQAQQLGRVSYCLLEYAQNSEQHSLIIKYVELHLLLRVIESMRAFGSMHVFLWFANCCIPTLHHVLIRFQNLIIQALFKFLQLTSTNMHPPSLRALFGPNMHPSSFARLIPCCIASQMLVIFVGLLSFLRQRNIVHDNQIRSNFYLLLLHDLCQLVISKISVAITFSK